MSKNEQFWKKTMDELDEQFVDETAEEMFDHLGERRELEEIRVDRPKEKKKSRAWIYGTAAAVVCVIGGVTALSLLPNDGAPNDGIEVTLPPTSTTTVLPIIETTPIEIPSDLPDPYEAGEVMLTNKEEIEIFESIFWGGWRGTDEIIRLDYNASTFGEKCSSVSAFRSDEGYFLQVHNQNDNGISRGEIYCIFKENPDIMYVYKEIGSDDNAKAYTKLGNESYSDSSVLLQRGNLNALGKVKLNSFMNYNENDGSWRFYLITSKVLYGEDDSAYEILDQNLVLENDITEEKPDEIVFTAPCQVSGGSQLANVTLTLKREENGWIIASAVDKEGNIFKTDLLATNTEMIDVEGLRVDFDTYTLSDRVPIIEDVFYGEWESYNGETFMMTYTEDSFNAGWSWINYVVEKEDGWYLMATSGGCGQLYYIPREEPETIYYYMDVEGLYIPKNTYSVVYKLKSRGSKEISTGLIGSIGMDKLEDMYGVDIWTAAPDTLEFDGVGYTWVYSNMLLGYGNIYLDEIPTENKIRFSRRYYEDGAFDNEYDEVYPEARYFTFTVEKIDGEWTITDTASFVPLDTSGSEYDVEYFHDRSGMYIAAATLLELDSHNETELYIWDGNSYTDFDTGLINCKVAEIDGVIYALFLDDEHSLRLRAYSDGEICGEKLIREHYIENGMFPTDFSIKVVGEYLLIYSNESGTADIALYSEYLDYCGETTADKVELSENGFVMEIDGEKIVYSTDEHDLEGRLWHLTRCAQDIFYDKFICAPNCDMNDSFTDYDEDGNEIIWYHITEMPYVDYFMFHEYVQSIFTVDSYAEIEFSGDYEISNWLCYTRGGARGSNIEVSGVSYSIRYETENVAYIVYTVYGCDENYEPTDEIIETHEVMVQNTTDGWRLSELYSPY